MQATQCVMYAGYKGYKPIASNTIYAYIATGYKGYKPTASDTIITCIQVTMVTSKLQATQCIMHTGYRLQGLQANYCKQHNVYYTCRLQGL